MTDKLRPRLRGGPTSDPLRADRAKLVAWFAGTGKPPWHALLPNFEQELFDDWKEYKAEHPDAVPPEGGYAWLDDETFNPDHYSGRVPEDARSNHIGLAALRLVKDGTQDQHSRLMAYVDRIDDDQCDADEGVIDADPRRVAAAILGRTPGATELAAVFGVGDVSRREAAMFVRKVAMGLFAARRHESQHE